MAEGTTESTKSAAKTEYRVLRKLAPDVLALGSAAADELQLTEGAEIYVLLPETFTGNVKRAVFDKHGEGEYVKVAARSLDPFHARKKEVVTFQ